MLMVVLSLEEGDLQTLNDDDVNVVEPVLVILDVVLMVVLSKVVLVCCDPKLNEKLANAVLKLVEVGVVLTVVSKPLDVLVVAFDDGGGTSLLYPGLRLSGEKIVVFFLVPLDGSLDSGSTIVILFLVPLHDSVDSLLDEELLTLVLVFEDNVTVVSLKRFIFGDCENTNLDGVNLNPEVVVGVVLASRLIFLASEARPAKDGKFVRAPKTKGGDAPIVFP